MRITGGKYRGMKLHAIEGRAIRPTSSRMREAIFDILGGVEDTRGLDLFCGAATFGLEAVSRGARRVLAVDRSPKAIRIARRNVEKLGVAEQMRLLRHDLLRGFPQSAAALAPYDWVFLDPPYDLLVSPRPPRAVTGLFEALAAPGLLAAGGRVLVDHRRGSPIEEIAAGFALADLRSYGDCGLAILRSAGNEGPNGAA